MKIQFTTLVSLAVLGLSATASPMPAESSAPSQINPAQFAQLLAAFRNGAGRAFRRDEAATDAGPGQINATQFAQLLAAFRNGSRPVYRRDVAAREIASADAASFINSLALTPAEAAQIVTALRGFRF